MTPDRPTPAGITISTRFTAALLTLIIAFLTLAGLAGQIARYKYGMMSGRHPLIRMFDLNREQNVPTYYEGIALFIVALLLAYITTQKWKASDRFRYAWAMLGLIFVGLSMDEMCSMHEQLTGIVNDTVGDRHGIFYYSWVIPGMVFVLVVGLSFLPFIWHFPKPYRNRIILSAIIFVSGAMGMEMVSGRFVDHYGMDSFELSILNVVEEFMEMTGIALFTVTLLRYISEYLPAVVVQVVECKSSVEAKRKVNPAPPSRESSRSYPHAGMT